MYDVVGIIADCDILCRDCACDSYTSEEISFVWYGKRYREVERWPMREVDNRGNWEYVYDEDGDILFEEDVYVEETPTDRCGEEIGVLLDDGQAWPRGENCGRCGEELIEPATVSCYVCNDVFAGEQEAAEIDKKYDSEDIVCPQCRKAKDASVKEFVTCALESCIEKRLLNKKPTRFLNIFCVVSSKEDDFVVHWYSKLQERVKETDDIMSLYDELMVELLEQYYLSRLSGRQDLLIALRDTVELLSAAIQCDFNVEDVEEAREMYEKWLDVEELAAC